MKKSTILLIFVLSASMAYSQAGHIMQGVGAVNMSMGGASTGQPLDISGAMQWNPAAISTFDQNILKFDLGLFFSSPKLSSSLPADMLGPGAPAVSGSTEDDRGLSPMPALGMVWGNAESKHTFGVSVFGISGFGVTFPEEGNNPLSPSFNPTINSNPINYPQAAMGFGRIESDYILLQIGFTWAYELSEEFAIGIQPNFNYATLELLPNPTANPTSAGYPSTDKATALGAGAQIGLFYESNSGFKSGISYKTPQYFGDFEFNNVYLDGNNANSSFKMNYPSIISFGLGYSLDQLDLALDYRYVVYENTEGFSKSGWSNTASVQGFGWQNISIISAGAQFKGVEKFPIRVGYTYSSNPISSELAFFNVPATAIIKNAFQIGFSFIPSERIKIDGVYHYGTSSGEVTGSMLNPAMVSADNPNGSIPGTSVSYEMSTSMIMLGIAYTFSE